MRHRGDLQHRPRIGWRQIADELAERAFHHLLVALQHAFEHDLALGRHQQILRNGLHHRQRASAQAAGDRKLVGALRHLRAHRRRGVMQREVRADADHDRQVLALFLGAFECRAEMPAEVELDGGAVASGQHQPVIGRVVDAGVGIARDDDAGGDVAAGVVGGVLQRRQHLAEIDVAGVHLLLRRRALDQHRRLRIAERAADELAHAAEVDAEGGFDIGLAGQQIADHRHVVAVDLGEQQRRPAVELFHHAGDFEIRIDRRGIGLQPAGIGHAAERRAKARVQNRIR